MRLKWVLVVFAIGGEIYSVSHSWSIQDEIGDIILNRYAEEVEMSPVVFPHSYHSNRYKCKECHEGIFIMKKGANDITEAKMIQGEYCGECHDGRDAFALLYCVRCHSGRSKDNPKTGGVEKK